MTSFCLLGYKVAAFHVIVTWIAVSGSGTWNADNADFPNPGESVPVLRRNSNFPCTGCALDNGADRQAALSDHIPCAWADDACVAAGSSRRRSHASQVDRMDKEEEVGRPYHKEDNLVAAGNSHRVAAYGTVVAIQACTAAFHGHDEVHWLA